MRIYITSLLLLISISVWGQQSGIQWIDNDLELGLKLAKQHNKIVFVYSYTTWCGPCKEMKKNVFPNLEVSEYYNNTYVNVKIDMEKGDGFDLSDKYNIRGYPTFLFLNMEGKMLHRSMGGKDVFEFLELGSIAENPNTQITTLHEKYAAGNRKADFLKQYTMAISDAEFTGYEPIAIQYLETQKDWTTPENIKFLFDYSEAKLESSLFQYTLKNRNIFINLLGKEKVNAKIEFAAEKGRTKAGIPRRDLEKLKIHYGQYYSKNEAYHQAMETYLKELMYSSVGTDQDAFISEIQLYLADSPDRSWNFYNAAAWQLYEITNDEFLLRKAADWTLVSISKNSNRHNNDTMAHILFKIGDKSSAQYYAEESIKLAKKEGADYSDTMKLLEQF